MLLIEMRSRASSMLASISASHGRAAAVILTTAGAALSLVFLLARARRAELEKLTDDEARRLPPLLPVVDLDLLVNLGDFRWAAELRLPASTWAYFSAPAGDGSTAARNERVVRDCLVLRPRVLVDVSRATSRATLFGKPTNAPFGIAPTAFHGLAHADGEEATARAAAAVGVVYCVSGSSSRTVTQIAEAAPRGRRLFQMYLRESRAENEATLKAAKDSGAECIVLTVDRPRLGVRDALRRFGATFSLPGRDPLDANAVVGGGSPLSANVTWADVEWLRAAASPVPIAVKGIMDAGDGAKAVAAGCAAVWVSNHAGRQLDGGASTAEVLPAIVRAVRAAEIERDRERLLRSKGGGSGISAARANVRTEVWVDCGVRRGSDVVKLIALGADFVWLGAPVVWGLAVAGKEGVERVLMLLNDEIVNAIALLGVQDVKGIGAHHVSWATGDRPLPS